MHVLRVSLQEVHWKERSHATDVGEEEEQGLRSKLGMSELGTKIRSFIQIGSRNPAVEKSNHANSASVSEATQGNNASEASETEKVQGAEEEQGTGAGPVFFQPE